MRTWSESKGTFINISIKMTTNISENIPPHLWRAISLKGGETVLLPS